MTFRHVTVPFVFVVLDGSSFGFLEHSKFGRRQESQEQMESFIFDSQSVGLHPGAGSE
jgi:hypothetical protein